MLRTSLRFPVAVLATFALSFGALAGIAATTATAAPPTLRLDGIGPLRLGMRTAAALRTGWLSNRGRGCELSGPPIPVVYRFRGPRAPAGVVGFATFRFGRLRNLSFSRGVRTALGVVPGRTTVRTMVSKYRAAGFSVRAQFNGTFGGTFVFVRRAGKQVLGGFGGRGVVRTLGVPVVPVCE